MTDSDRVKILVVDDLQEKLLVYRTVLESSSLDVITATSGAEALRQVLAIDFAVILLDVNMPGMDGYETASLIRKRKRSAHTPIIFVTAYADELHALKGYSYGAVDYILSPVVPDVLRTKVRVFVDLFRNNAQMQRQAEALRELQARQHRRELDESNERLQLALDAGRMGTCEWDMGARLLNWSPSLEAIFGFEPGQFAGQAEELSRRVHPDDRERVLETLQHSMRGGGDFQIEHRIHRRGGETAWVELRGKVFPSENGESARFSGVCIDITERKRAEHALEAELAATKLLQETSTHLIQGGNVKDLYDQIVNAAIALMGSDAACIQMLDRDRRSLRLLATRGFDASLADSFQWVGGDAGMTCGAALRVGHRVVAPDLETCQYTAGTPEARMLIAAGVRAVQSTPLISRDGEILGMLSTHWREVHEPAERELRLLDVLARQTADILERDHAEQEIKSHRDHLEQLVVDRTAELRTSHERLRLTDRLASIGTLAAGLGHDMGNLLLPIRARIASLEAMDLSTAAREHIVAIKTAGEYLKRLSQGLRLFALDPTEASTGAVTNLHAWWLDVEPFLRNALPKSTTIETRLQDALPPIRMPPHTFTQVIYNLVQNAGDAMRDRSNGLVRIEASVTEAQDAIVISVSDNGPGMTDEVRQRCMEPFFTTRTRGISTGLGLALVRGAVYNINGAIDIDSRPGGGTVFRLTLPAATASSGGDNGLGSEDGGVARIDIANVRLAAYLSSLLRGMRMDVRTGPWSADEDGRLLVLDQRTQRWKELRPFLEASDHRRALVFSDEPAAGEHPQVVWLTERATPSQTRAALQQALTRSPTPTEVVSA